MTTTLKAPISRHTNARMLAKAIGKAIAESTWIATVKVHALQVQPKGSLWPYESPDCLAGEFIFRVELHGSLKAPGVVYVLDGKALDNGLARLHDMDKEAFNHFRKGKAPAYFGDLILQLGLFGYMK